MGDLLALAGRCERAVFPAPDDAAAHELVEIRSAICHLMLGHGYDAYSPDYVGSLDAAMTLVPEGCRWTMDSWAFGWSAGIWRPVRDDWLINSSHDRQSKTPALALCAVALRARHAIESVA